MDDNFENEEDCEFIPREHLYYDSNDGSICFDGYYWFNIDELKEQREGNMFIHLCSKNWFTESDFWKLVELVRKKYPEHNLDKTIWDAAQEFHEHLVWENKVWYAMIFGGFEKEGESLNG